MIERYHFDINNWESKNKITPKVKQNLKQILSKNKIFGVLIQTFGDGGYHSFIHKKKRLRKYIPINA